MSTPKLPPDNVEVRVMCGDPVAIAWMRLVELSNQWVRRDQSLVPLNLIHTVQHHLDVADIPKNFLVPSVHVQVLVEDVHAFWDVMEILLARKISKKTRRSFFSHIV